MGTTASQRGLGCGLVVLGGALLVLMGGCRPRSRGDLYIPPPPVGTLEVYNLPTSRDVLTRVETEAVGSGSVTLEAVRAAPGTGVFFERRADWYDVQVFSETGLQESYFDVPVREARTTTVGVRF